MFRTSLLARSVYQILTKHPVHLDRSERFSKHKSNHFQSSHLYTTSITQITLTPVSRQQQTRKMSSSTKHIFENEAEKEQQLNRVLKSGWTKCVTKEAIFKSFKFQDFNEAFTFMTAIAMQAEKMDHHPEWFNVYNKVDITLASHFCNGISKLDISCADYIDKLYSSRYSKLLD